MSLTATTQAPLKSKAEATNGKAKEAKKSFKEMTEKEKVAEIIKSAEGFSKSNGYKGIELKVRNKESGEDMAATDDGYGKRFEKIFKIKIYAVYRKGENKIGSISDAEYQGIKALAVASLAEQKTKKYGKDTIALVNACIKLKGAGTTREWDDASVSDWTL